MAELVIFLYLSLITIANTGGQSSECRSGTEWDSAVGECVPCRIGYYRNSGSHDRCVRCQDPDYITSQEGATSDLDCDMPVGSRAKCPSGTEWISRRERCVPCKRGTYRTKGINYWCVPCKQGKTTSLEGATSSDQCQVPVTCPLGTTWSEPVSFCEPCPRNTYRNSTGSDACIPCPEGHVTKWSASTSVSQCLRLPLPSELFDLDDCPSGTEPGRDVNGAPACIVCPVDTYRTSGVHDGCVHCPNGTATWRSGASSFGGCLPEDLFSAIYSSKQVIVCPLGTEWRQQPVEGCYLCPRGTYRDTLRHALCSTCPTGSDTPQEGTITAMLCGLLEVTAELRDNVYKPESCPLGTEWSEQNHACVTCSFGYHTTSRPVCEKCPDTFTTARRGATSIDKCQLKFSSSVEAPYFFGDMCPGGSEFSSDISGCVSCPRGFYKNAGHRECLPCPKYYTTLAEGSTDKGHCIVPKEGPVTTRAASYGCPEGYQLTVDGKHCTVCPLGTYKSAIGRDNCTNCPIGAEHTVPNTTYQGAASVDECVQKTVISHIEPSWSLQSMSLEVAIQLSAPSTGLRTVTSVSVGSKPCHIIRRTATDGTIHCMTSPSRDAESADVVVELLDSRRLMSPESFTYRADPVINSVQRTRIFASGGLAIDINGDHFRSADTCHMTLRRRALVSKSFCRIVTENLITCISPNLTSWMSARWLTKRDVSNEPGYRLGVMTSNSERVRREEKELVPADLGFVFDNFTLYDPISFVLPEYDTVFIYPDPVINELPGRIMTLINLENPVEITLAGSYLNAGALFSDYSISIGGYTCSPIEVTWMDITCRILDISEVLREGEHLPIEVSLGSLRYYPGRVVFGTSPNTSSSRDVTAEGLDVQATTPPTSPSKQPITTLASRRDVIITPKNVSSSKAEKTETAEAKIISPIPGTTTTKTETTTEVAKTTTEVAKSTVEVAKTYLIPVLISTAIILLIVIILVVIYFEKKRRQKMVDNGCEDDFVSVDNLLYSVSSSGSERASTSGDPSLPPLPVESVFGPDRRTDRGISQRGLAFPPDTLAVTLREKSNRRHLPAF